MRNLVLAGVAATTTLLDIAKAVNTPLSTVQSDVSQGCKIFRIWVEFSIYASATADVAVSNFVDVYIWKNPGANLTAPAPASVGTSNEKKFVFRMWKGMIGARTQGAETFKFRGWIKIPKIYQRMGTDDTIQMVFRSEGTNSLLCAQFIYKWFR